MLVLNSLENQIIVLVLLIILLCLMISKRKLNQAKRHHSEHPKNTTPHTPYKAVSIQPGYDACDAILALRDKRFLATEAIGFPLSACNASRCSCRYQHHSDRRSGKERRHARPQLNNDSTQSERRQRKERRQRSHHNLAPV